MEDEKLEKGKKVVKKILKEITGENFVIKASVTEFGLTYFVSHFKRELMGLIVGRGGEKITSLRNLMKIWGILNKCKVSIIVPTEKPRIET